MFLSYLNLLSLGIVLYCIYVLQPLGCKQAINVIIIISNAHNTLQHPVEYTE